MSGIASSIATFTDALRLQADARPSSVCCTFEIDETLVTITYAMLIERASAYGATFAARGVGAGEVVFVLLPHGPDLLYAFVGAILAECTPAFLAPPSEKQDPGVYRDTLVQLFANTGARAAVIDAATTREIGDIATGGMQLIEPSGVAEPSGAVRWPTPAPDDIAFLQFSSGTTGLRKGTMLTHRIVMAQLRVYADTLGISPARDRIVSWLPLYHDMGLIACTILPLVTGTPFTVIDPLEWVYEPDRLFKAIARDGGTLVWLPNFAFNHLSRTVRAKKAGDLSQVRAFIDCSEPCKIASLRGFAEAFASAGARLDQMQTCYAMAEAVFAVTQSRLGAPPRVLPVSAAALADGSVVPDPNGIPLVSVGPPLPGFEIALLDDERRPVGPGRIGEIAIRGPSLFAGYYRSPSASAEPFHEGWFCTGDLGFVEAGEVFVTGRLKDVIIFYGRNFYSHDIEELASSVSGVKPGRAVAFGVYSDAAGSEEVVVVAETEAADAEERTRIAAAVKVAVLEALNLSLSRVVLVDPKWLVKTSSGKISRSANAEKFRSQQEA